MSNRWLEPKNDYKKLIKCPSLTRVDPEGYSIKIRSKMIRKMILDMKGGSWVDMKHGNDEEMKKRRCPGDDWKISPQKVS